MHFFGYYFNKPKHTAFSIGYLFFERINLFENHITEQN